MARTGLYKSDVKKARESLLAQGRHPSVDAVRIELGNTGSKTTIHKYLKELEEEDGHTGDKPALSEAIADLVGRLAAQLRVEADAQIEVMRTDTEAVMRKLSAELDTVRADNASLNTDLLTVQDNAETMLKAFADAKGSLQQQALENHGLQQQLAALKERLAENQTHRQSLEEKHQHARQALEHYRASVKEQRDQDIRRHEQQTQMLQAELRQLRQEAMIKQEEVTRVNQEAVRLVADLSHARQAAHEAQSVVRDLTVRLDSLAGVNLKNAQLEAQVSEKENALASLQTQFSLAQQARAGLVQQLQQQQLELVTTNARHDAQLALVTELKALLASANAKESPADEGAA